MKNNHKSLLMSAILYSLLGYPSIAAGQTEPTSSNTNPAQPSETTGSLDPQTLSKAFSADEVVWLEAQGEPFFALHLEEQSGSARGGVIILTQHYHQPSERYWINNLRQTLPNKKWHSLVLAMPQQRPSKTANTNLATETEAEAENTTTPTTQNPASSPAVSSKEYNQQKALATIDAAVGYFNSQGVFNMAIISEGVSTIYAMQYIGNISSAKQKKQIRGLALINARNQFNGSRLIDLLATQELPMLDVYFDVDYRDKREAQQRRVAGRQLPAGQYLQIAIPKIATHWGDGENRLSKRVRGWLDRTSAGFEIAK